MASAGVNKAARRALKKQRTAEARARRVHLEIWPEPVEEPVMVECDDCRLVQVNAKVWPGDIRFVFPCICSGETSVYA